MSVEHSDGRIQRAFEELNQLIIDRVKLEQRRDQLTGLQNDLALEEALGQHLLEGKDLWVAFVEIDRMKSINDRVGYQNADELIKSVAQLLAEVSASLPPTPPVSRSRHV